MIASRGPAAGRSPARRASALRWRDAAPFHHFEGQLLVQLRGAPFQARYELQRSREDLVFDAGGIQRRIRVFRLPDDNAHVEARLSRRIALRNTSDNALYIRITQEDGHLIWSSPIYVIR